MPKPPQQRRPVPDTHLSLYSHGEIEAWIASGRPLRHLAAFLWLRSRAAFTDNTWEYWQGKKYMLKKGELLTSRRELQDHLGLSGGDTQRFLEHLQDDGLAEVEQGNAQRPTRVRLVNYEASRLRKDASKKPQATKKAEGLVPEALAVVSDVAVRGARRQRSKRKDPPFPDAFPVRWPHSDWKPSDTATALAGAVR